MSTIVSDKLRNTRTYDSTKVTNWRHYDGAYGQPARRQSMHGRGNLLTVATVLGIVGIWAAIVYLYK